ncbi:MULTISPECIES: hypothetical protein [unclassified Sphingomonas]|uniref:hypothetical protein n=1 Tax=unclassified Sphingomonas TaxID=196159 RepID=UPI0025908781|nr:MULTISPECIES: hypothetical protein [unclassified Sphingomonas]
MSPFRAATLLLALAAMTPASADRGLSLVPSAAQRSIAQRQNAVFSARLDRMSTTVDRLEAAGLAAGRIAFLRQDIARVADMIASAFRLQGWLKPVEERGYTGMLDQIERKIARAAAERRGTSGAAPRH